MLPIRLHRIQSFQRGKASMNLTWLERVVLFPYNSLSCTNDELALLIIVTKGRLKAEKTYPNRSTSSLF